MAFARFLVFLAVALGISGSLSLSHSLAASSTPRCDIFGKIRHPSAHPIISETTALRKQVRESEAALNTSTSEGAIVHLGMLRHEEGIDASGDFVAV